MPQNEIAWTPCWPSCTWRPEDLAIFVNQYLGPQFEKIPLILKSGWEQSIIRIRIMYVLFQAERF